MTEGKRAVERKLEPSWCDTHRDWLGLKVHAFRGISDASLSEFPMLTLRIRSCVSRHRQVNRHRSGPLNFSSRGASAMRLQPCSRLQSVCASPVTHWAFASVFAARIEPRPKAKIERHNVNGQRRQKPAEAGFLMTAETLAGLFGAG